jgi:hypothetical protein
MIRMMAQWPTGRTGLVPGDTGPTERGDQVQAT